MADSPIVADFTAGVEGEKVIAFRRPRGDGAASVIMLWDGYFAPIMEALWAHHRRAPGGAWPPLLQHWVACTAFADADGVPWQIEDLPGTIAALDLLTHQDMTHRYSYGDKAWEASRALLGFLREARVRDEPVFVAEE